jgi:hypothetical protein
MESRLEGVEPVLLLQLTKKHKISSDKRSTGTGNEPIKINF